MNRLKETYMLKQHFKYVSENEVDIAQLNSLWNHLLDTYDQEMKLWFCNNIVMPLIETANFNMKKLFHGNQALRQKIIDVIVIK